MEPKNQITSINLLKAVAALGVICIHTKPFDTPEYWKIGFFIEQLSRFSVPFFFIASGYFFQKKLSVSENRFSVCLSHTKNILWLFLAWSVIYTLYQSLEITITPNQPTPESFINLTLNPLPEKGPLWLLEGGRVHLWFLPSLAMALIICTASLPKNDFTAPSNLGFSLIIGLVLYCTSLLLGPYSHLHGFETQLPTRLGPLVSTVFVAIGMGFYEHQKKIKIKTAWILALGGAAAQLIESHFLQKTAGSTSHEFLISTIFFGSGVFLITIKHPNIGASKLISKLGQLSLGIYTTHMLLLAPFKSLAANMPIILSQIFFPLAVFFGAAYLTHLLSMIRITKPLVTTNGFRTQR